MCTCWPPFSTPHHGCHHHHHQIWGPDMSSTSCYPCYYGVYRYIYTYIYTYIHTYTAYVHDIMPLSAIPSTICTSGSGVRHLDPVSHSCSTRCIMGLYMCTCIYYTVYIAVFAHIQVHLQHAIHQLTSADPKLDRISGVSGCSAVVDAVIHVVIHT